MDTSIPHQSLSETELRSIKKRVAPQLLHIAGISGVGMSGGRLAVYLEGESDTVRQAVEQIVRNTAPGVPVTYVVTGKYRTQ